MILTSLKQITQISPKEQRQCQKNHVSPRQSLDFWLTKGQSGSNCFCCAVLKCQISDVLTGTAWIRLAWRNPATRRSLLLYLFAHRWIFTFNFFSTTQMTHFPVISSCTDQSTPTASVITRPNVHILSRTSYCVNNAQSEHGSSDGFRWSIIFFLCTHAVPHYW